MNERNRIAWITPDYYYDTDWAIVEELKKYYEIYWIIINSHLTKINFNDNRNIDRVIDIKGRFRNPANILLYIRMMREIKRFNPSVVYCGYEGTPFFAPILFLYFDHNKIIFEGHEIDPKKRVNKGKYREYYLRYMLNNVGHVQVFSKHVEDNFKKLYPKKECSYIPMVPKDYGLPSKKIDYYGKKVFLFFGTIRPNKRLDLLIDAFTSLEEDYQKKAQLLIFGKFQLEDINKYKEIINKYDNIEADFGFISDNMIPVLFSSSDFLVQPYQSVSQSGPTMISYNYNVPIIGSDISGFTERIIDGYNGFIFKANDKDDLKRTLKICIDQTDDQYGQMCKNLKKYIETEYSFDSVISKYKIMIDRLLKNN